LIADKVWLTILGQIGTIPAPRQDWAVDGREGIMKPSAVEAEGRPEAGQPPTRAIDTRQLGRTLRSLYEDSVDTQPITDTHVELLLRLRQKERELRRAS
jgi:hypothetical protein